MVKLYPDFCLIVQDFSWTIRTLLLQEWYTSAQIAFHQGFNIIIATMLLSVCAKKIPAPMQPHSTHALPALWALNKQGQLTKTKERHKSGILDSFSDVLSL